MASSSDNHSRTPQQLLETARRHSEDGRTDQAIAAYRELLQLEPNQVRHWLTLAYLEGEQGNLEASAAIFRKLGSYYEGRAETAKAAALFQQVLVRCPRDTAAHLKLAKLQLREKRSVESWNHYRAALALLLEADQRGEAVQVLEAMTSLQAENVVLWVRLGETAVSAGMPERAVSAFKKAMVLLRRRGRTEHYLRVGERVLGLAPDDLQLTRALGAAYLEQEDVTQAMVKLRRCYEGDPHDAETLSLLAEAFIRLGSRDKAVNALQMLADLHLVQGNEAQHALTRQRLLELAPAPEPEPEPSPGPQPEPAPPDGVSVLLQEAASYAKIGLHDGAADALRQARALDPTHEQVFSQLKAVYAQMEDEDALVALLVDHAKRVVKRDAERAAALLDEAQALNPDHPAVFRARIGPLDPLGEVTADEEGSAVHMVAEQRGTNERSSMKLMADITEVTVKRQVQPDVTVKINVDGLEQTLIGEQSAPPPRQRPAGAANPFEDIGAMGAQASSPRVLLALSTGEIDLGQLRQVLEVDSEPEDA